MEIKKLGDPVAIINQLILILINYHHTIVSNPSAVICVKAKIRDQFYEEVGIF